MRADGRPSPALARRIRRAAEAAEAHPQALLFCSGGVGRCGPAEAQVMAGELVRQGLHPGRLVRDEASLDTLQSAIAARRFMREVGLDRCLVVTDSYHTRRGVALMRVLGVWAAAGAAPATLRAMGLTRFVWMRLRELVALPYDVVLAALKRRSI